MHVNFNLFPLSVDSLPLSLQTKPLCIDLCAHEIAYTHCHCWTWQMW